jgi:hypothetical protein
MCAWVEPAEKRKRRKQRSCTRRKLFGLMERWQRRPPPPSPKKARTLAGQEIVPIRVVAGASILIDTTAHHLPEINVEDIPPRSTLVYLL